MITRTSRRAGWVAALALAAGVPGCAFAVDHPAVAAGVSGAALGFGTCKLESDDYAACGAIGGSVGAGLAVVAALALWLGGDGHTVLVADPPPPPPPDAAPLQAPAPSAAPSSP